MVYLTAAILALCSIMPSSLNFELYACNIQVWTFLVLLSGFAGFFLLFQKVNPFVKLVAIGGFLNCFFSLSFRHSGSAYITMIATCYFYWMCTHIKDWDLIFKVLISVVLLNCFMLGMQALGRDSLLNFGRGKDLLCFGTTGARMQVESLLIVSSALIIQSRYRIAVWSMAVATGLYLLVFKINAISQEGFLHNPFYSRIPVWRETIVFANQYPWSGWGIGTFKLLYHSMSKLHNLPWAQAHNDYLQILFETGYPGLCLTLGYLSYLSLLLLKQRRLRLLFGLLVLLMDMTIHFPLREFQCFLIVVAFLAYCEVELKRLGSRL